MSACVDLGEVSIPEFSARFQPIEILGSGNYGLVFKGMDTVTNRVIAIKLVLWTNKSSPLNTSEIDISCGLDSLRLYTDSLIKVESYGTIMPKSSREIKMLLNEIEGYFRQFVPDKPFLFYTTPIYTNVSGKRMSIDQQKEALFEIIYTIVVLNKNGILHGDLNANNIIYRVVDYKRQYTINHKIFTCQSPYLPILIDFGLSENIEPTSRLSSIEIIRFMYALYSDDDDYPALEFDINLKDYIKNLIATLRFDILLDPIFEFILETPISGGDMIKVMQPIQLDDLKSE